MSAEAITSGPLKDQPSFTRPLSPEGREVLQGLVMDMYDQFVGMVATGRHMDAARVRELADGRAYTGRQALKLGLVDAIGGEHDARRGWPSRRAFRPICRSRMSPPAASPAGRFRGASAGCSMCCGKACFPKELSLTAHGRSGNVPAAELIRRLPGP